MFQIIAVLCVVLVFMWIKISDIHIDVPDHDHIGDTLTHSNTVFYYDNGNGMPHKYILNKTERIKYYMGKWYNNNNSTITSNSTNWKQICGTSNNKKDAIFQLTHVFSTERYINDNTIIMKSMQPETDWDTTTEIYNQQIYDPLWNNKISKVIWRGNLAGFKTVSFVEQYYDNNVDRFDVAFTQTAPFHNNEISRPNLSMADQLKYKYIVCIEYNDMLANLRWILISNSVLFMPIPEKETWIMEGLLIPYIHFIPITFNESTNKWNLNEQYEFCMNRDEYCNQIAQNGRSFVIQNKFFDGDNDKSIEKQIVEVYCKLNNTTGKFNNTTANLIILAVSK